MSMDNHFDSAVSGPLDNANVRDSTAASGAMLHEVFQSGYQVPQTEASKASNANDFLPPVTIDSSSSRPPAASKENSFESAGDTMLATNPITEVGALAQKFEGFDSGTSASPNQATINPVNNASSSNQAFRLI